MNTYRSSLIYMVTTLVATFLVLTDTQLVYAGGPDEESVETIEGLPTQIQESQPEDNTQATGSNPDAEGEEQQDMICIRNDNCLDEIVRLMQNPISPELIDRSLPVIEEHLEACKQSPFSITPGASLSYSIDGKLAIGSKRHSEVYIWDNAKWAYGKTIKLPSAGPRSAPRTYSIAYNPDGTLLATGTLENVYIWDEAANQVAVLPVEETASSNMGLLPTSSLSFSPDGTKLATGTAEHLYIWDTATWTLIRNSPIEEIVPPRVRKIPLGEGKFFYETQFQYLEDLTYNSDGTQLALGLTYGYVNVAIVDTATDITTGKFVVGEPGWDVNSISYSPDGRLAVGSPDKNVYVLNPISGDVISTFPVGHEVDTVKFSPNGKELAAGTKQGVFIFGEGAAITLPTRSANPVAVAYSSNGDRLAVSGVPVTIWMRSNVKELIQEQVIPSTGRALLLWALKCVYKPGYGTNLEALNQVLNEIYRLAYGQEPTSWPNLVSIFNGLGNNMKFVVRTCFNVAM